MDGSLVVTAARTALPPAHSSVEHSLDRIWETIICWPAALILLILYPFIWLVLLPFRLVGIAVEGVFDLIRAIFFFPARVLGARRY